MKTGTSYCKHINDYSDIDTAWLHWHNALNSMHLVQHFSHRWNATWSPLFESKLSKMCIICFRRSTITNHSCFIIFFTFGYRKKLYGVKSRLSARWGTTSIWFFWSQAYTSATVCSLISIRGFHWLFLNSGLFREGWTHVNWCNTFTI